MTCIFCKDRHSMVWECHVPPPHLAFSESVGERRDKRKPAIRRELIFLRETPQFFVVVWDKFVDA